MDATMRATNVWTHSVGAREARAVARALRAAGYRLTIARVREIGYVNKIAAYCEPGDPEEQHVVRRLICEAAGIQPHRHD